MSAFMFLILHLCRLAAGEIVVLKNNEIQLFPHNRFRDMKALAVGMIVLTPLLYAAGGLAFIVISLVKGRKSRKKTLCKL